MEPLFMYQLLERAEKPKGYAVRCFVNHPKYDYKPALEDTLKSWNVPQEEYDTCISLRDYGFVVYVVQNNIIRLQMCKLPLEQIPETTCGLKHLEHILLSGRKLRKLVHLDKFPELKSVSFYENSVEWDSPENKAILEYFAQKGVKVVKHEEESEQKKYYPDHSLDSPNRRKIEDVLKSWELPEEEYTACLELSAHKALIPPTDDLVFGCQKNRIVSLTSVGVPFGCIPEQVRRLKSLGFVMFVGSGISKIEHLDEIRDLYGIVLSSNQIDWDNPDNKTALDRLVARGAEVFQ